MTRTLEQPPPVTTTPRRRRRLVAAGVSAAVAAVAVTVGMSLTVDLPVVTIEVDPDTADGLVYSYEPPDALPQFVVPDGSPDGFAATPRNQEAVGSGWRGLLPVVEVVPVRPEQATPLVEAVGFDRWPIRAGQTEGMVETDGAWVHAVSIGGMWEMTAARQIGPTHPDAEPYARSLPGPYEGPPPSRDEVAEEGLALLRAAGLDVDQWDTEVRDITYTGTAEGLAPREFVMRRMLVVIPTVEGEAGRVQVDNLESYVAWHGPRIREIKAFLINPRTVALTDARPWEEITADLAAPRIIDGSVRLVDEARVGQARLALRRTMTRGGYEVLPVWLFDVETDDEASGQWVAVRATRN